MSSPSWSLESSISQYSNERRQKYYIGRVLIPTTLLRVDATIQRPFDQAHASSIKPMYATDIDTRSVDPLECVVPLAFKDKLDQWIAEQDPSLLSKTQPEDMLVLSIHDCYFLIIKGQHRYKAYCQVMEENNLPVSAPHPGHMSVELYHSGESALLCNWSVVMGNWTFFFRSF